MAAKGAKKVPLGRRMTRATRRGFYKAVHAVTPAGLRRSIRGGPAAQKARQEKRKQRKFEEQQAKRRAKAAATQARKDAAEKKTQLKAEAAARKVEKERVAAEKEAERRARAEQSPEGEA